MERIEGVKVQVRNGEKQLTSEKDGYLGIIRQDSILLELYVDKRRQLYGFHVFGRGQRARVLLKKDRGCDEPSPDGVQYRRYTAKMRVLKGTTGAYTNANENTVRLIELHDTNVVTIWEVAVIAQFGKFFLTIQPTRRFSCYLHQGYIVCPSISKWKEMTNMTSLINSLWSDMRRDMPMIETHEPPKEDSSAMELETSTAFVLWFNYARGVGALQTNNGTVRVHWTQVPRRSRRAFLVPRERVRFKRLVPPEKNDRHPTAFKLEAQGVSLLT